MIRGVLLSSILLGVTALASYAADANAIALTDGPGGPMSKFYVAATRGKVDITQDGLIHNAETRDIYKATNAVLQTAENADIAFVLSNSTGVALAPQTRVVVKQFDQDSFSPNRTDLDLEPSVSHTNVDIQTGILSLCTSRPQEGSHNIYHTPDVSVDVHGKQVEIEVRDNETIVRLLEGKVTLQLDPDHTLALTPNQEAVIPHRRNSDQPCVPVVSEMSHDQRAQSLERIILACTSRTSVFFDMVVTQNANGTTEKDLSLSQVVPAEAQTQYTISPANLISH